MAGIHQLWTFDPATGTVEAAAGTTNEGLVDGPLAEAWFAQTSGLAADGDRLWIADSETSSLRVLERPDGRAAGVHRRRAPASSTSASATVPASDALLQHPLGVAVLPDGTIAIADTYNGAVRRFDPAAGALTTIATGLAEPIRLYVDGGDLLVVESAAHRLGPARGVGRARQTVRPQTQRPVTEVGGMLTLTVAFTPPPGRRSTTGSARPRS